MEQRLDKGKWIWASEERISYGKVTWNWMVTKLFGKVCCK